MSFWRTFGFHTISPVENILDRENFTLEELLDEEDVLQETKAQNKKLIDYFVKPETISKFVFYLTQEPEEAADTKRKFKYPYVCCEILCSEVWSICEAFFEQDQFASSLLAFFDREQRLNALLANYVCKVCSSLLSKKSNELLTLMRKKDDLIGKLMRHLNTSPVMDLLLKIIVTAEDSSVENNEQVLLWLRDSNLISRLIEHFQPQLDTEIHENVATALIEIIVAFSQHAQSPLLAQLESEPNVNQLLDFATAENTSAYGLTVVIELLGRHVATQFAADISAVADLPPILRTVCAHVPRLLQVLRTPPNKKFLLPFGEVVPLGFYRLKVVEFFAALVRTNYRAVNDTLMQAGMFGTVLELFFHFEWNDFLHAVVGQLLSGVFAGADGLLKNFLVSECKLAHRLMQETKENDELFSKPGGVKKGFMAFVPTVASAIVTEAQKNAQLQTQLNAIDGWEAYVNGSLAETKSLETNPLAGVKPPPIEHDTGDDMMGSELVLKYLVQQGFARDVHEGGGGGGGPNEDEEEPHRFVDSFDDGGGSGSVTIGDDVVTRHIFTAPTHPLDDESHDADSDPRFQPLGQFQHHDDDGGGGDDDDPTFIRHDNIGSESPPQHTGDRPLAELHADATPPSESAPMELPPPTTTAPPPPPQNSTEQTSETPPTTPMQTTT